MPARLIRGSLALIAILVALWMISSAVPAADKGGAAEPTMVHLTADSGGVDAYVATPTGSGRVPVVIIAFEWWGLGDQIKDVARRMAKEGYVAIVPDLYHGKVADTPEMAHELVRGLEDTRVFSEMDAAAAWAAAQPRTKGAKIGVMGFCVGGGIALRYALHNPNLSAAVMYYGAPESDPAKLAALKAPLQGHFGAEDQGIPPDHVEAMRGALKKAGKHADLFIYPGAGHAFMHDGKPSYKPDAAKIAWARTLGFLQRYLKG